MKVVFDPDPEGPWLNIRFVEDPRAAATEEKIEFIVSENGGICAIRVWLDETVHQFSEEQVENITVNCTDDGWNLSATDGHPWIFYQFARARGKISIIDWMAEVFTVEEEKRITEIEVWLRGLQRQLHLP